MRLPWRYHARMIGKLVAEIDVRGCMGEEHALVRIAEIVEIDDQRVLLDAPNAQSIICAKCREISSRELEQPVYFLVAIADGCFQPSSNPNIYFWRH